MDAELKIKENFDVEGILHPELFNVIPSSAKEIRTFYLIEFNGEVLWAWRLLKTHQYHYFTALNECIKPLGYSLSSNSSNKIGISLRTRVYHYVKRVRSLNTKTRKANLAQSWFTLKVFDEDMVQVPQEIIKKQKEEEEILQSKVEELNENLKEECAKVYEVLKEQMEISKQNMELINENVELRTENENLKKGVEDLKNKGKLISDVQPRQKYRKLNQIR